ncbi:MAG: MFS transporter [Acidobacteria bacterium]|nr:MFS transporter [Acidobacteriota bacterium]
MSFPDYLGEPAELPGRQERPRPARIRDFAHAEWLAVAAVCLGAATSQVDNGVITVAYPRLVSVLGRPLSEVVWIGLVPFVTLVATLLLFGRRADSLGRKKVYVNGFVVFITGALMSTAFAKTFPLLLLGRGIGALGIAMIQANSVALITASVRDHQRTTALGIQAAAQAIGLAVGPFLGSVITPHLPVRFIFLISTPLASLAFLASVLFLPRTRHVTAKAPFNVLGALLLALSSAGALGGLTLAAKVGWSPNALGMILLGGVSTMALIGVERHVAQPIFTPRVFRRTDVRVSIALLTLSYVAFFGLLVAVPFFVVSDFGASARRAAEATMAIPVGLAIVAPFSGRLRRRWGTRMLTSLAGAVLCVAILGAAVAPNGKVVAALLVLVGFAIGIVNTTTNAVVMSAVELKDRGLASGTVNLARAAGSALGMALATSVVVILQNADAISLRPVIAILAVAAGGVVGVAFRKIPRDQ